MKFDVCIVAGRRPDLLSETLSSFTEHLFSHHEVQNVFVNIDPIFGDGEAERDCVGVIRSFFKSPVIFTPETPGFAAAVKRLWAATTSDHLVHLEDDWLALDQLDGRIEDCFRSPKVKQVSFHTANQNWTIAKRGHLHRKRNYIKFLGLRLPTTSSYPKFTTSPSIIDGHFARTCSHLMDPQYDPEKQLYSGINLPLEKAVAGYDNYIFSPDEKPVIVDTGRAWRDQRLIAKNIRNATSYWEPMVS